MLRITWEFFCYCAAEEQQSQGEAEPGYESSPSFGSPRFTVQIPVARKEQQRASKLSSRNEGQVKVPLGNRNGDNNEEAKGRHESAGKGRHAQPDNCQQHAAESAPGPGRSGESQSSFDSAAAATATPIEFVIHAAKDHNYQQQDGEQAPSMRAHGHAGSGPRPIPPLVGDGGSLDGDGRGRTVPNSSIIQQQMHAKLIQDLRTQNKVLAGGLPDRALHLISATACQCATLGVCARHCNVTWHNCLSWRGVPKLVMTLHQLASSG